MEDQTLCPVPELPSPSPVVPYRLRRSEYRIQGRKWGGRYDTGVPFPLRVDLLKSNL